MERRFPGRLFARRSPAPELSRVAMPATIGAAAVRLSLPLVVAPSICAHNLRKFLRMRPNQCVAGFINQTADGARYATRERVEVVSGYGLIMRSSDDQRRHGYLLQPRPAVKCNEPPD